MDTSFLTDKSVYHTTYSFPNHTIDSQSTQATGLRNSWVSSIHDPVYETLGLAAYMAQYMK